MQPDALATLAYWINERHAIYMRKWWLDQVSREPEAKTSPGSKMREAWQSSSREYVAVRAGHPWTLDRLTTDPVLSKYRFCNVYRELDRVTVWIRKNIREPFADHEHLWYMLAAARYINWPATLAEIMGQGSCGGELDGWPYGPGFEPWMMTAALEARRARGEKVETGAYMIRAESDTKAPWYSWSKQRYVSEIVLGKLWEARAAWATLLDRPLNEPQPSLREVWERFQQPHWTGWGPFMAYQVIVDMRHTRYLREAPDIQTWAALGPGSRRGLNRLAGREVSASLSQERGLAEMLELREVLKEPERLAPWVSLPDLSDVQNCLCEFDKYERVRLGQGEPRARYVAGRGW